MAVLDAAGQVLRGASTDTSGHATVTLPRNAHEIEVSYIGLQTQRLDASPGPPISVTLPNVTHALEAVVVTGGSGAVMGGYVTGAVVVTTTDCGFGSREIFGGCVPLPAPEPPAPVTLFPNPSPGQVTLRLPADAQLLNVYTAHGRLLLSQLADASYAENILHLPASAPAGTYIVEVVSPDGLSSAHPWQVIR